MHARRIQGDLEPPPLPAAPPSPAAPPPLLPLLLSCPPAAAAATAPGQQGRPTGQQVGSQVIPLALAAAAQQAVHLRLQAGEGRRRRGTLQAGCLQPCMHPLHTNRAANGTHPPRCATSPLSGAKTLDPAHSNPAGLPSQQQAINNLFSLNNSVWLSTPPYVGSAPAMVWQAFGGQTGDAPPGGVMESFPRPPAAAALSDGIADPTSVLGLEHVEPCTL